MHARLLRGVTSDSGLSEAVRTPGPARPQEPNKIGQELIVSSSGCRDAGQPFKPK